MIRCFFLLFALNLASFAHAASEKLCPADREYLQEARISCAHLKAGVVLLQFWASWCPSCSSLTRDLEAVASARPTLRYIAISTDDQRDAAVRALVKLPETRGFRLHDVNKRWAQRFLVQTVPTVIVLGVDGKTIYRHEGHLSAPDLLAIGLVLDEQAP